MSFEADALCRIALSVKATPAGWACGQGGEARGADKGKVVNGSGDKSRISKCEGKSV